MGEYLISLLNVGFLLFPDFYMPLLPGICFLRGGGCAKKEKERCAHATSNGCQRLTRCQTETAIRPRDDCRFIFESFGKISCNFHRRARTSEPIFLLFTGYIRNEIFTHGFDRWPTPYYGPCKTSEET